ncbi:MAG: hypothetical protein ACE37K_17755 [Planctomycetota bacterium]
MPASHHLAILVLALCAAPLAAQRPVVTVGGSNPSFADLPQAVAAAAPGSIVDVRPGLYTGFSTSKPLRVVLHGATVQPAAGASYAIEVHGVTGPDQFVLAGDPGTVLAGPLGAMRVDGTHAPVVIESVILGGTTQPGLEVFNTGSVFVTRSILLGNPALTAQFCNLTSCENVVGNAVGVGAIVQSALFESSRAIYLGTNQPALRVFTSDVRLSSDGTGSMLAIGSIPVPISAVEAFDSTVTWDPARFTTSTIGGAPVLGAQQTVEVIEDVPMMNAGPAPLGGVAMARMVSGTPVFGMIAMGFLLTTPNVFASIGYYVDPANFVLANAGLVDGNGLFVNIAIPNDPALRGNLYCFQGVTFPASGIAATSNAALWHVE